MFCSNIQSLLELESVIVATATYIEHTASLTYPLWSEGRGMRFKLLKCRWLEGRVFTTSCLQHIHLRHSLATPTSSSIAPSCAQIFNPISHSDIKVNSFLVCQFVNEFYWMKLVHIRFAASVLLNYFGKWQSKKE